MKHLLDTCIVWNIYFLLLYVHTHTHRIHFKHLILGVRESKLKSLTKSRLNIYQHRNMAFTWCFDMNPVTSHGYYFFHSRLRTIGHRLNCFFFFVQLELVKEIGDSGHRPIFSRRMTSRRDFDISRLEATAHGFSAQSARSSFFLDSPSSHGNSETGNQRPELDDLTEQVANLGGSVSIYWRGSSDFGRWTCARTMLEISHWDIDMRGIINPILHAMPHHACRGTNPGINPARASGTIDG